MEYNCLANGGGGNGGSKAKKRETEKKVSEVETSQLGALKLDADEIDAFEKWMTEPSKPTDLMIEAAKAHKVLRARQIR